MSDVLKGISELANRSYRQAMSDQDFADWALAFYESSLKDAIDNFDSHASAIPSKPTNMQWAYAWATLENFRSELNKLRGEYVQQQFDQDANAYLARLRREFPIS